jgi:mono/diheme cytochrome c family protein
MKAKKTILLFLIVGVVLMGLAVACGSGGEEPPAPPPEGETTSPELDGEELLEARCTGCHGLDLVQAASKSEAEWTSTVDRMIGKGADLTEAEAQALVEYLAETHGP